MAAPCAYFESGARYISFAKTHCKPTPISVLAYAIKTAPAKDTGMVGNEKELVPDTLYPI